MSSNTNTTPFDTSDSRLGASTHQSPDLTHDNSPGPALAPSMDWSRRQLLTFGALTAVAAIAPREVRSRPVFPSAFRSGATSMRVLTYVGRDKVEWREAVTPRIKGPGEALVRPIAVSVCDFDRAIVRGKTEDVGPFTLGHECIAEVIDVGESVSRFRPGNRVCVPYQVSCGVCSKCLIGLTGNCEKVPSMSTYGFGPSRSVWGGMFADVVRVPFADSMLVRVPRHIDPTSIAALSDTLTDGWSAVVPNLPAPQESSVLVLGSERNSVSLYAAAVAVSVDTREVIYADTCAERLALAERLGAKAVESFKLKPHRNYALVVDGSGTSHGRQLALGSTAENGSCVAICCPESTSAGMARSCEHVDFKVGRNHARSAIPEVLKLIETGTLSPDLVTSRVVAAGEAVDALLASDYTKLVIAI